MRIIWAGILFAFLIAWCVLYAGFTCKIIFLSFVYWVGASNYANMSDIMNNNIKAQLGLMKDDKMEHFRATDTTLRNPFDFNICYFSKKIGTTSSENRTLMSWHDCCFLINNPMFRIIKIQFRFRFDFLISQQRNTRFFHATQSNLDYTRCNK